MLATMEVTQMSNNVLILDAGCQNFGKGGELNHYLSRLAEEELTKLGWNVEITLIDSQWEIAAEAEKIKKADVIIVQTPGWWMSTPWQLKRYEDLVFVQHGVVGNDGRSHLHPDDNYGRGGILTDKKFMISSTWNAPKTAFDRKGDFFEGRGVDGVFFPLIKAFEFLGMKQLPSFMCNDVVKNPHIGEDVKRWKEHLRHVFKIE